MQTLYAIMICFWNPSVEFMKREKTPRTETEADYINRCRHQIHTFKCPMIIDTGPGQRVLASQDVLPAPGCNMSGGQARLAAAQVAVLQGRLATNPASLQLVAAGQTAGHVASPAAAATTAGSTAAAASRSLAAMLRVAAVEAPTTLFSTLHLSPALSVQQLGKTNAQPEAPPAGSDATTADGSWKVLAEAAGVHGRALTGGVWMAPRLVAQPHMAPGSADDQVAHVQPSTGTGATEGSVIVTGERLTISEDTESNPVRVCKPCS